MANSAQQSLANTLTPNDGTSYVDGVLTDDNTGQPVDDSNAVVGNDGSILTSNSSNNDDDNNVVSNVTNAVTISLQVSKRCDDGLRQNNVVQ